MGPHPHQKGSRVQVRLMHIKSARSQNHILIIELTMPKCLPLFDEVPRIGLSQWTTGNIHNARIGFSGVHPVDSMYD